MTHLPKVFKALADPSRLRIVNILSQHSLFVCDLQTVLQSSQPFISRHLACLRRAGLVRHQRHGTRVYYSLAEGGPLASALRSFMREVAPLPRTLQADLERLAEYCGSGRLKSCAFVADSRLVTSAPGAERELLASKAA